MADRDPDTIKRDIDQARDQLAATVDTLAVRANPQRIANDIKAGVVRFLKKPAVAASLAFCRGRRPHRRVVQSRARRRDRGRASPADARADQGLPPWMTKSSSGS